MTILVLFQTLWLRLGSFSSVFLRCSIFKFCQQGINIRDELEGVCVGMISPEWVALKIYEELFKIPFDIISIEGCPKAILLWPKLSPGRWTSTPEMDEERVRVVPINIDFPCERKFGLKRVPSLHTRPHISHAIQELSRIGRGFLTRKLIARKG